MAIAFVILRGEEHQVEYRTVAVETDTVHTPPETVEWEFAEPTKFTPDLTTEEVAAIERAVEAAIDNPH